MEAGKTKKIPRDPQANDIEEEKNVKERKEDAIGENE